MKIYQHIKVNYLRFNHITFWNYTITYIIDYGIIPSGTVICLLVRKHSG